MEQVPGLPVYSVWMPVHVCLKIFYTCFKRSKADILLLLPPEVACECPVADVLAPASEVFYVIWLCVPSLAPDVEVIVCDLLSIAPLI